MYVQRVFPHALITFTAAAGLGHDFPWVRFNPLSILRHLTLSLTSALTLGNRDIKYDSRFTTGSE